MERLIRERSEGSSDHSILSEKDRARYFGTVESREVWRVEGMNPMERLHHHAPKGYRVVKLVEVVALKEVLEVRNPRTGCWKPVHVFYDTGSEISGGTSDLLAYDLYDIQTVTEVIRTIGYNARQDKRFDHVLVSLRGERLELKLAVSCDSSTQKMQANRVLDLSEWRDESFAESAGLQVNDIPMILLGIPHSNLHPTDIDREEVPLTVRLRYPNLSWKRSRFSGKVMAWGSLESRAKEVLSTEMLSLIHI